MIKQKQDALEDPDKLPTLLKSINVKHSKPERDKQKEEGAKQEQKEEEARPGAAPSGLASDLVSQLRDKLPEVSSGLKWEDAGVSRRSQGRELNNSKLASALVRKRLFTQQEWDLFGIKDLGTHHFIKVGSSYFRPAKLEDSTSNQIELAQSAITVEEVAANPGDELARIIRRQLLDQIVEIFDPNGKRAKKLREQVELYSETIAIETAGRIVESLWTVLRSRYDQSVGAAEAGHSQSISGASLGNNRFRAASTSVMTAN